MCYNKITKGKPWSLFYMFGFFGPICLKSLCFLLTSKGIPTPFAIKTSVFSVQMAVSLGRGYFKENVL